MPVLSQIYLSFQQKIGADPYRFGAMPFYPSLPRLGKPIKPIVYKSNRNSTTRLL
jgi:hypothetical protein